MPQTEDLSPIKQNIPNNINTPPKEIPQNSCLPKRDQIETCAVLDTNTKLSTNNILNTATKLDSDEKLDQKQIKIEISEFDKISDKQNSLFYKLTFCVLGISSIIGWNAVLSSFSFFASKFGLRVYNSFTIPLQVGTFLVGAIVPIIAPKISTTIRVSGSMTIMTIILAILPIIAQLLPSESESENGNDSGFIICVILTFLLGSFNSLVQNSMAGLAAQEGGKLCGIFWMSNGLSGLLMAILSILCTLIFPSREDSNQDSNLNSTIVFFTFAVIISVFAIFLSQQYIKKEKLDTQVKSNQKTQTGFNKQNIIKAIKYAGALPIFICFIYIVTFSVFPGLMLANIQFSSVFLSKQSGLWGLQFLNLTFQIGDVSGRQLGANPIFHKKIPQYVLSFIRVIFVISGIVVAYKKGGDSLNNDWFPFLNMFLMAFTNGFSTSSLMGISPRFGKGDKEITQIIGFICAFMLTFGIAIGSLIAYPLAPTN